MKKLILSALVLGLFVFTSCEEEDELGPTCLVCTGDTPEESVTRADNLCVGAEGENGETVTLEALEITRDFLVAFGADCELTD